MTETETRSRACLAIWTNMLKSQIHALLWMRLETLMIRLMTVALLSSISLGLSFSNVVHAQPDQISWETANPQMREFLAGEWVETSIEQQNDTDRLETECEKPLLQKQMWKTESHYQGIYDQYPKLETANGGMSFLQSNEETIFVKKYAMSTHFEKYDAVRVAQGANGGEFILQFLKADQEWDSEQGRWEPKPQVTPTVWFGVLQFGARADGSELAVLAFPMTSNGPFGSTKMYLRCGQTE